MLPSSLDQVQFQQACCLDQPYGPALARELITLFVRHTAPLLPQLEHASAVQDLRALRALLYRLEGSATTLGGLQLGALCADFLERVDTAPAGEITTALGAIRAEHQRLIGALREEDDRLSSRANAR